MFLVKIFKRENPRSQISCRVTHLAGTESGSIQIVKPYSKEIVLSFPSSGQLNLFLKNGNAEYGIVAIDRPKVYYTNVVIMIHDGEQYWCQATIWPEGEEDKKTIFRGSKKPTREDAAKAFWFLWNHGNHPYKTDEGSSARLTRLKQGYEEVVV
jgi:hypothetical protein